VVGGGTVVVGAGGAVVDVVVVVVVVVVGATVDVDTSSIGRIGGGRSGIIPSTASVNPALAATATRKKVSSGRRRTMPGILVVATLSEMRAR